MSKNKITVIAAIGMLILLITSVLIVTSRQSAESPDRLISLGENYLTELNYEQALVHFLKVIEIDPMNPRGYIGAAEAYVGLGRTEDAIAILRQGLERTGDDRIRDMFNRLYTDYEDVVKESEASPIEMFDQVEDQQLLSPADIAAHEPWKLFDNVLQAHEIVLGGMPIWDCTLDSVAAAYPGGGWSEDGKAYFSNIQFSIDEDHVYAGYMGEQQSTEFRGLHRGMDVYDALNALGLSSDGILFVKEAGKSIIFNIDDNKCSAVNINQDSPYDLDIVLCYTDVPYYDYMLFTIGFNNDSLDFLEASLRYR